MDLSVYLLTLIIKKVILFRKSRNAIHSLESFDNCPVSHTNCQRHLSLSLDEKLTFNDHIEEKIFKVKKGIGILRKFSNTH